MGIVENVDPTHGQFPRQSEHVGGRARVCFAYDRSRTVMGTVVRDDLEAPGRTIIALDDGPVVLATECQWSPE